MVTDKVADLITRIRNAQKAKHKTALVTKTKMNKNILDVLIREGFIDSYADEDEYSMKVTLRYSDDGQGVIKQIKRISKPGCRSYVRVKDIKPVFNGLGVNVISTSKGVLSDYEAIQHNVSGELLFSVF